AERHLRALLTFSACAPSIASEEALYERTLETLAASVDAQQAAVLVLDHGGDVGVAAVRQLDGASAGTVTRNVVLQAMQGKVGLLTRVAGDALAAQSVLCVPIVVRDQSLAAIYVAT